MYRVLDCVASDGLCLTVKLWLSIRILVVFCVCSVLGGVKAAMQPSKLGILKVFVILCKSNKLQNGATGQPLRKRQSAI
jgi:hypothetical protein